MTKINTICYSVKQRKVCDPYTSKFVVIVEKALI